MRLSKILRYTIAESDNIGCDILLKDLGGPKILEEYRLDAKSWADFHLKTQSSKRECKYREK